MSQEKISIMKEIILNLFNLKKETEWLAISEKLAGKHGKT